MALRPPSLNARCISKMVSLFSALRAASGDPPGFPEYPGANLPLMRPLMALGAVFDSVFAFMSSPGSEGLRISNSGESRQMLRHFLRPAGLSFGSAATPVVVCQCAGKPLMIKVDADGGLPA